MRIKEEIDSTNNSTVFNRLKRYGLNCSLCKPHRGENANRDVSKHGAGRKPKYKDHR